MLPVNPQEFEQVIIDLGSILALTVLFDKNDRPSRAYVRPSIHPGFGRMGITLKPNHEIDSSVIMWNWPSYFSDPEKAYHGRGLTVIATGEQRLFPILGKHASNYGDAGRVGTLAKNLDGDEALFFAPYGIRDGKREYLYGPAGKDEVAKVLKYGVIADGPGEEIIAITDDGKILYPPKDVNRLGGTTLDYIAKRLGPKLGFTFEERPFTLEDFKTGKIIGMAMIGNAVRVAPVGQINIHDPESLELIDQIIIPPPEQIRQLVTQYEAEVSGQVEPSDHSLLTPVDLDGGMTACDDLYTLYQKWFS